MAHEFVPIDIANAPDLAQLVEAVRQSGKPHAVKRGAETLVVIRPAPRKEAGTRSPRRRKTGRLTPDDSLFKLIGIGASGHSDVSSNKYKYLAQAYRAKTQ